jgi:nucleotide-binding universal stress UspA family protein
MKILVGLGPGDDPDRVIEQAVKHARHFNGKVYLLTSLGGGRGTTEKEVEQADNRLKHAKGIFQKADISCETHLLIKGNPPEIDLLEFAEEKGVDEIIVGARKRSPVGKALLGSVTQNVSLGANCPVVLVK